MQSIDYHIDYLRRNIIKLPQNHITYTILYIVMYIMWNPWVLQNLYDRWKSHQLWKNLDGSCLDF